MQKVLLLPILFFIIVTAYSQNADLIKNYKFRVEKYKAIDLGFNTNGQNSNNFGNGIINRSINAGLNTNLICLRSTDKIYRVINSGLITSFESNSKKDISNPFKIRQANITPYFTVNNKWYFKNNFLEIGTEILAGSNSRKETNLLASTSSSKYNVKNFEENLVVGVGKGRLENVTDMQNAIWLAKILEEDKNLSRKLTLDEINGLAKELTKSNNFRILDNRRKIIYTLKVIDKYLQSKNVIAKTDINYFANLNDILYFANNAFRQSGTIKYVRLIPHFGNNEDIGEQKVSSSVNKYIYSNKNIGAKLRIGYEKYKPINLYKQLEYGFSANALYNENKINNKSYSNTILISENDLNNIEKNVGLDYFINYKFYPNTRTVISAAFSGENKYQFYKNSSSLNNDTFIQSEFKISVNANYFINHNTRFLLEIGENYTQRVSQNTSIYANLFHNSLYANAGIRISI